jgi:uncharacterized protein
MKSISLRTADGTWIAHDVRIAGSFASRCLGLLRNRSITPHDGLLLTPAASVHTLGMRFAIDVVFLSRQMRVLGFAPRVPPWRVRLAPPGTGRVLELAAGQIAASGLALGMFIVVDTKPEDERPQRLATVLPASPTLRSQCERLPIQFSLRLPPPRRCAATANTRAVATMIASDWRGDSP